MTAQMHGNLDAPAALWARQEDVQLRLDDICGAPSPHRLALMLYGSHARGTADSGSDIDVLELVTRDPGTRVAASANITQYLPSHLITMAEHGSLFVLHLRLEGRILSDPTGVLSRCLSSYRKPLNYDHVVEHLRVAAGALDPRSRNLRDHIVGLSRLGIYLLRTAAYLRCIEKGEPTFDVSRVTEILEDPELAEVLAIRRRSDFTLGDVRRLREYLELYLPDPWTNDHGSIEGFAVATADRPDVAALLTGVLSGASTIEYTALTTPPL